MCSHPPPSLHHTPLHPRHDDHHNRPSLQESVHFFRYNKADNKLYCFADDVHPRYITAMTLLDYDTVAAGDKFGNFFVLRLPQDISAQVT